MKTILSRFSLFLLFALSLGSLTPSQAQNPLSLDECISIALQNNATYLNAQQGLEGSYAALNEARAPFEIKADMIFQLPSYRDRRDTFVSQALVNRFREESTDFTYRGQIQFSQQVQGLGQVSLSTLAERVEFTSNRRSNFTDFLGDVRLGYTHELLTDPAPEVALRRAKLRLNSNRLDLSRQKLQLEFQVTNAYLRLVQTIRGLDILERRRTQTISSVESARNKLELGIIPEVEVQRLELDLL